MKLSPFLVVLLALLCVARSAFGEPEPEPYRQNGLNSVSAEIRANPRFYVQVDHYDRRSIAASGSEEDDLTAEEEAELADEEEEEESSAANDIVETYYPVSANNGQTYLISESVLQVLADKQEEEAEADSYLDEVDDDDEEVDDEESHSAIILQEESAVENDLSEGSQLIAIVQGPEAYGKGARRPVRRGAIGIRRRRGGGRRRRIRRGGSRKGLKRRRTRRRIRRGGGSRGGRRRRGGGGGGRIRLGRIRVRRGYGYRF